ncbi:MAG: secondary thiamine-phosphate synthase enzyme YjbQ [Rhizomicrobium sp.]
MKQHFETVTIETHGPMLYDFTDRAAKFVRASKVADGLLTCFIRHTSASLAIQENADPDVLKDLNDFFKKIAPPSRDYRHDAEGPDDMPSHIRSALTQTSLSVPVRDGAMVLGPWQALYVFEHRDTPHSRHVVLHVIGE